MMYSPSKVNGLSSAQVQSSFSPASSGIYVSPDQCSRDLKNDKIYANKNETFEGSTEPQDSISRRGVAFDICDDPLVTNLNFIQKNDNMEVDAMDSLDLMEQDVKVCDICGDAGWEYLLAICFCCSDGAEHVYCMREMMTKVPEGEWLCEECQTLERMGNRGEENMGQVDEIEKNNPGLTNSKHLNNSDIDGQNAKGLMRIPSKWHRDDDDVEISSIVKKPALESKLGSPRPLNSNKIAVLPREFFLKSLDKGKVHSHDIATVNDMAESGTSDPRLHSFRGDFLKSNSLSSLNSKPKVKLVDQAVIKGQKSAKEVGLFHRKEGVVRSIGKSMSFKSRNSGRPESKVKMLSPRLSHTQDIKNTKKRISFERQHAFRSEHLSINSMIDNSLRSTSRIDKRPSSLSTVASIHQIKPEHAFNKSATLSRSSSLASRKTADEFKRPSIHGNCTVGGPFANVVNSNDWIDLKSDCVAAERSALNMDEGIRDGLPRPRDLTTSSERIKNCFGSRSGPPSAMPARVECDNLKVAIEAALLRKPEMYRKNRADSHSDGSSMPCLGVEVTCHQDPISSSARSKIWYCDAELPELPMISWNLTADSHKEETCVSVKQSSLDPLRGILFAVHDGVHISSSRRYMLSNIPAGMHFFFKSLAVPEHEYIWQGSFAICRSDKSIDSWDGIQAHLSSCASPKVTEAVNKFSNRISFYEVPRSSTWPIHFQEHGVREDNIALFFFAKDLDSYNKIYKVLLDNMMKNDLALKGNVNGVELLIFPSCQLPDNSQRWNMSFFLWGVFIEKKESCMQQIPESMNQLSALRNIPRPIMSLPESRCSLRPIAEDLNGSDDGVAQVLEKSASEELRRLLSSIVDKRDCDTKSLDRLDLQLNSCMPPVVQSDNANQCQDKMGISKERDPSSNSNPCHGKAANEIGHSS